MLSVLVSKALCESMVRYMYVAMPSEVLEQLNLTQCALCQDLFAENIRDLLDRNAFVCLLVRRRAVGHMSASICTSCRPG